MLTPDRIKPFILHADEDVRQDASMYFADSFSDDTTPPLINRG